MKAEENSKTITGQDNAKQDSSKDFQTDADVSEEFRTAHDKVIAAILL